jgi:YhcH/YjgK/YiaL family protein
MILDLLSQWHRYSAITPHFARAFAFLEQVDDELSVGRHEIVGEDVFAIVQRHATHPVEDAHFEVHRKYIDVQYILRGREVIYWAPLELLTDVFMPFDEEKDAALYGFGPEGIPIPMLAGHFAVFFPSDAHIPSCRWEQSAEVQKVVVKVRIG